MWDLDKFSANTALIDDLGNRLTYGDLRREGEALSSAVGSSRALVFCMAANKIGSVIGYVGMMNAKIVPTMLNEDMDEASLSSLIETYRPAFIWVPGRSTGKSIFHAFKPVYSAYDYVLLKTPYGFVTKVSDETALLLTTSGSTGSPKFVRQSFTNVRTNINSIVEFLQLDETERPITTLPMNYTYGLSIINTHIDVGAAILMTEASVTQRAFWSLFKEEGATSFGGVPYTYEMLKRLRFLRMDLPSLRSMTQAGGRLLPELHREFAEYAEKEGKKFFVMYGQCEATARMAYLPPDMTLAKIGSVGIPVPGGRFELIDVDGKVIDEPDKVGELVYYGANVTLGYATSPQDLIKGDERGGRLETGDMAKCDSDGFYYIVGRKKRFLKIFGNRVNLDDVECFLRSAFPDVDSACGGVDDLLYIFADNEEKLPAMKQYVSEKTKIHPSAFKTVALESVPRSQSGKIIYAKLASYYEQ